MVCLSLCLSQSHQKENIQLYVLFTTEPLILLMVKVMLLFSLFLKLYGSMVAQNRSIQNLWFTLYLLNFLFWQTAFVIKITNPEGVLWSLVGFCLLCKTLLRWQTTQNCKGFFICVPVTVQCANSSFAVWEDELVWFIDSKNEGQQEGHQKLYPYRLWFQQQQNRHH